MKQSEKPIRLEDVELVPDAMERFEGAIKHAARKPIAESDQRRAPCRASQAEAPTSIYSSMKANRS